MDPKEQQQNSASEFAAKPALSLSDVCLLLDLPPSTMAKLDQEGKGPVWFLLGRRKYVLREAFHAWLLQRASDGAGQSPQQKVRQAAMRSPK